MDSKRLAEIADVMEDRGLTRVRVEEPDGTAVELERASAATTGCVPCLCRAPAGTGCGSRGYARRTGTRRADTCRRAGA